MNNMGSQPRGNGNGIFEEAKDANIQSYLLGQNVG
jgi:hypothetical protein